MGRLTKYGEDGWMKLLTQKDEYGNEIIVTIERIAGAILVALLPQILIAAIFFLRKRKEAKEK